MSANHWYEVVFTCLEYDGGDIYVTYTVPTELNVDALLALSLKEGVKDLDRLDPEDPEYLGTWYPPHRIVAARWYRRTRKPNAD